MRLFINRELVLGESLTNKYSWIHLHIKRMYFGINDIKSMISHELGWYHGFSSLVYGFFLGGKNDRQIK